ncbi:uncharacterized protein CTRU02_202984 [Colletotrichum truncatum]|uniref:Uncharacterized protein n=1 Tax=Colletotrichum truncatum TaxID=5467 RepID=A0ACC3Z815_COLTU|nr:uncharacterized protein CTRU02_13193 [Colletotrichum truncatum]KAF6783685.1 hypothetical protein CTRU02_13193 [Colletotrichum truncatum]
MAGVIAFLSAAAPIIPQGIAVLEGAKAAEARASASAFASRAALLPAVAPAAPSTIFPTLPLATLAAHNNTYTPKVTDSILPKAGPTPAVQNQPPQVIVETNYIIITKFESLAPTIVTVTQTQQPNPPLASPPNALPLVNPGPGAALLSKPSPLLSSTPKTTPEAAAASSSPQQVLPIPPVLAPQPSPPSESALSIASPTTLVPQVPSSPLPNTNMSGPAPGRGEAPPPNFNPQAQTGPPGDGPPMGPPDPANGAFLGGVPTKNFDLPITVAFMLLFMLGAYVHLSIYKRNAKRGHKFLISDIIFDFCMIRTVTCIFRITWSIVTTRGVVLMALITENGGASVMFAVNIFFAQRLVRSIHPKAGWCTAFGQFTIFLLLSVPAMTIFNATNLIITFFSVGNVDRLETTDNLLKFGSAYNMFLAAFPVIVVTGCLCIPGPKPEKFGTGSQRVKVALLFFGAFLLMAGQAIRLYASFNKEPPGTNSILFGKTVFYTTGFMFELLVIAAYAFGRVDLRFHVPNGSSGPGDYSGDKSKGNYTVEEIERLITDLEVPHQIMRERKGPEDMEMVFTIFFATKNKDKDEKEEHSGISDDATVVGSNTEDGSRRLGDMPLPERNKRITRRQTIIDAFRQPLPRQETEVPVYPDITDFYAQMDDRKVPSRPARPSMYSEYETGQGYMNGPKYDARTQQYRGVSPPYENEKRT